MPCTVRIQVELSDEASVRKALQEMGLLLREDAQYIQIKGGGFYNKASRTLSHRSQEVANAINQRYGIVHTETLARAKGWKSQRKAQADGQVQVVIRR